MSGAVVLDQGNVRVVRCDTNNLRIQVQILGRQLVDNRIDVMLSAGILHQKGTPTAEHFVENSRATLDRQPLRSAFDLHQVVVVEESHKSSSGKVQGALVCRSRPTEQGNVRSSP